jgi:hypothetical protein
MPASPRNPSIVSFLSEKFQLFKGGPLRIFLPAVPNWPTVFEQFVRPGPRHSGDMENMFGLNHWSSKTIEPDSTQPLVPGSRHGEAQRDDLSFLMDLARDGCERSIFGPRI